MLFDPTEMLVLILIYLFIYTVYVAVVLNLVSFFFSFSGKEFCNVSVGEVVMLFLL